MEQLLKGLKELPKELVDLVIKYLEIKHLKCFLFDPKLKFCVLYQLLEAVEIYPHDPEVNSNVIFIDEFHEDRWYFATRGLIRFGSILQLVQVMDKYEIYPKLLFIFDFIKDDEKYIPSLNKIEYIKITLESKSASTEYLKFIPLLRTNVNLCLPVLRFSDLIYLKNVNKLQFRMAMDDENIENVIFKSKLKFGNTSNAFGEKVDNPMIKTTHLYCHESASIMRKLFKYFDKLEYFYSITFRGTKIRNISDLGLPTTITELCLDYYVVDSYNALKKMKGLKCLKILESKFPMELFDQGVDYFPNMYCFWYYVSDELLDVSPESLFEVVLDSNVKFPKSLKCLSLNSDLMTIDQGFKLPPNLADFDHDVLYTSQEVEESLIASFVPTNFRHNCPIWMHHKD